MYIKICIVDDGRVDGQGVGSSKIETIPQNKSIIVECDEADYRKVQFTSRDELDNIYAHYIREWETFIFIGEWEQLFKKGDPESIYTLIELVTYRNSIPKRFIVVENDVYVMNDNGKTIDKIIC